MAGMGSAAALRPFCAVCAQCQNESARLDSFLDIPLVVRPYGSDQAYSNVVRCSYYVGITRTQRRLLYCVTALTAVTGIVFI